MKTKIVYPIIFLSVLGFTRCDNNETETPKTQPTIITTAPTIVSTNSATVGGNITGNGNETIIKSGVVYSSNVAVPTTVDNKVETNATGGPFTVELTGLISGTTYHFRAFATNSIGTAYGETMSLTTSNLPPEITDLRITGKLAVGEILTAEYTYTDAENDAEGATTYQWFSATNSDGSDEGIIDGATNKTLTVGAEQDEKFLRVSVFPRAAVGTTGGNEVKSAFTAAVGVETITFDYGVGDTKVTVTYNVIVSATTQRKWLDRNLGATQVAQSATDYKAFGDMFQWGRLADGHQLITRTGANASNAKGVTGITSTVPPYETSPTDVPTTTKFIINGDDITSYGDWRTTTNSDLWQGVSGKNNPCPSGWRIATREEWISEGIIDGQDGFKKLKLTYGGGTRFRKDGTIINTDYGYYWTSTRYTTENPDPSTNSIRAGYVAYGETTSDQSQNTYNPRSNGAMCRCIKD